MINGWKIEYGQLTAKCGPDEYAVHECDDGWTAKRWSPEDEFGIPSSTQKTCEGAVLPGMKEAIEWCEADEKSRWTWVNYRDAERRAECPPQAVSAEPGASTATGGMSGKTSCAFPPGEERPDVMGSGPTPPAKPGWQASFDARDWAKEFMRCNREQLFGGDPSKYALADEETMVGWFANALMRGYGEHRRKAERAAAQGGKSEQVDNLAWSLKNEAKRSAERDNELAMRPAFPCAQAFVCLESPGFDWSTYLFGAVFFSGLAAWAWAAWKLFWFLVGRFA